MSETYPDYILSELRPDERIAFFVPTPGPAMNRKLLRKLLPVLGILVACALLALLRRNSDGAGAYLVLLGCLFLLVYLALLFIRRAQTSFCFTSTRAMQFVRDRLALEFNWKDCARPAFFEPRTWSSRPVKPALDTLQNRFVRIALRQPKPASLRRFLTGLNDSAMGILSPTDAIAPEHLLAAAEHAWKAAQ